MIPVKSYSIVSISFSSLAIALVIALVISSTLPDMINQSLVTDYVPQSFKLAVIKPLLKKPTLNSAVLANYIKSSISLQDP